MSAPNKRRVPEPHRDWFTRMDHEVEKFVRNRRAKASRKLADCARSDQQVTQARMEALMGLKLNADSFMNLFYREVEYEAERLRDGATVEPGRYKWDPQLQTIVDSRPDLPHPAEEGLTT